ncbi:hypothetical protein [Paenibacillus alba]|uniref:Head decoration protein n=1 Tax=Paenibacillus alba TaxID=1197127 RepID=A0ABU6GAR9_9BACL|nr:hypothetical protein [Paenibacillus alba]MEC0231293.1 hypothetical protein [Paenibacillus alba]
MTQDNFNFRVPGVVDGQVFVDKNICLHADYNNQNRVPLTIAANTGDLDKGTVMGVTAADGYWRPVRRAPIQVAIAASGATATLTAATIGNFKQGDPVFLCKADGSGAFNAGTITLIAGIVITFSTAATGTFAIGDYIYVKDGSEVAQLILGDVVQDATSPRVANAFFSGNFILSTLIGVDNLVTKDLMARAVLYYNNNANDYIYIL